MSDWPEGWVRGPREPVSDGRRDSPSRSRGDATQAQPRDDSTRVMTPPTADQRSRRGAQPPPFDPRTNKPHRPRRPGRVLKRVLLVLLLVLALLVGLMLFFYSRIDKVDALQDYDGRPAETAGNTWLLVGSDSREGLSDEERKRLRTGRAEGRRTDTVILLHKPSDGGPPTMVSLPRDSYVPIPGHGRNKLNAAYAFGGAPLLVQTVEQVTGIRLDHYTEVGFGGFVGVVDSIGGVELCPPKAIRDRKSGLHVEAGCQEMDGPTSLGYVRARYFDPKGDLGRVERQQDFLSAIFERASSPSVLLNPFRLVSLGNSTTKALTIDERDGPIDLVRFALTMRAVSGKGAVKTTVPVADPNFSTPAGSAVKWDRARAIRLFNSLR
jgi:LCP family protein required for cell wall assembly